MLLNTDVVCGGTLPSCDRDVQSDSPGKFAQLEGSTSKFAEKIKL